jgi:hypothetical protein
METPNLSGPPEVAAYRSRAGQLWIICPFCRSLHFHGPPAGHRVAHCPQGPNGERAPEGGYVLREEGSAEPPAGSRRMRSWSHRRGVRITRGGRESTFTPGRFRRWNDAAYGVWTCADGREVVFNRFYEPIVERRPGGAVCEADGTEWVPDIVRSRWFYNDGGTDAQKWRLATRAREAWEAGQAVPVVHEHWGPGAPRFVHQAGPVTGPQSAP